MQRFKNTRTQPPPRQGDAWLAGMMIGTAIITMVTQAILLGAGAAIQEATLRRDG